MFSKKMILPETATPPIFSRKDLSSLIWPLAAEQALVVLIGLSDTFMVASLGEVAVSGVSLVDQFSYLLIQLFTAFATGGAVISSQYLGQKNADLACDAAKQLLNIALLAGIIIVAIFLPFRHPILKVVYGHLDAIVMDCAVSYFVYICLSLPFLAVYNSCAALFRSMGNSRITLKTSILMNAINIVGNAVLIFVFHLGVHGAGIATLASRFISAIAMVVLLCNKKNLVHFKKLHKFQWNTAMVRRILRVGIPSGIENSMFHFGRVFVQSYMSSFGTIAIAANAICNTIVTFANIPGQSIGLASITIVGRCIGAGEKKQAKSYGRKLMVLTYASMSAVSLMIFAFSPFVVSIYNISALSKSLSVGILRTCMVANILFWPLSFTMPNILRSAGDAKFTMIVSNFSMWAFRVLSCYILGDLIIARYPQTPYYALYGTWAAMYIDWIFRSLCFGLRFHRNKWLESGKKLLK